MDERAQVRRIWVPDIGKDDKEIEIIQGCDVLGFIFMMKSCMMSNDLTASQTRFGWTSMGECQPGSDVSLAHHVTMMTISESSITNLWNLDVLGIMDPIEVKQRDQRDALARRHFLKTVHHSVSGRYVGSLPWTVEKAKIADNREVAMKRLEQTTKKLISLNLYEDYDDIFRGWLDDGIIEKVPAEQHDAEAFYLPHRPVVKLSSGTTPIRPVFDASSKVYRSSSLNDCLEKGPNLIEMIPNLMLRFRNGKFGVVADIKKAFLQIEVNERDRDYLRFLWYSQNGENTEIFRHRRVVFGVNCSPFILGAVIEYHLSNVRPEHKPLAQRLQKSFYVDNSVISVNSFEELQDLKLTATSIMENARLELSRWEHSLDVASDTYPFERPEISKVLAIPPKIIRRSILSCLAQIYDPIGFLNPILIKPKILLQKAWTLKLAWDDELDRHYKDELSLWFDDLQQHKGMAIPRNFNPLMVPQKEWQIHTFVDASSEAYAAVVFLRTRVGDKVEVHMMAAKSRVAPLKRPTIPRLELLACVVGARLNKMIFEALELKDIKNVFWSDATTALAWIKRDDQWGTFVGNRVKEICRLSDPINWRYVPSECNPADLPSRGLGLSRLIQSRWWEGPSWLKLSEEFWPSRYKDLNEEEICAERKKIAVVTTVESTDHWYMKYFSPFIKNVRMMAWIRRFINNLRSSTKVKGELSVKEICSDRIIQDYDKKSIELKQINSTVSRMEGIKPPAEFVPYSNEKKWETWRESFEIFAIAVNLESMPLVRQRAILKHIAERQGIMEFVTELKHLAQECEFENLTESLIRDRLIIGILDREVKRKLLEDPQLTLPRAISIAMISESTCSQVASLNEQNMIEKIEKRNWVKDRIRMENAEAGPRGINPRRERIIEPCKWCGQRHNYGKCPAYGKKCNACGKTNHFAVVFRTKHIRNLLAESEAEESCDEINLNEVVVKAVGSDKWSAVIIINGKKTKNCLSSANAMCYAMSGKKGMFEFIVADVEAQTLITGDTCEKLEILRRINHINTDEMKLCSETQKIIEQYHEVFQGVGLINSECKIYTKPEYSPVQVPPRRIPTSLGAEVQSELEKMVKQGIVKKIYHETEWSHPMVVVKKKSGQIRICLDPPELLHEIPKSKYHTVLDVKSAYWHIPVAKECRDLLVMTTPFGKFRYNRLPFGLKISAQIFVEKMTNIFRDGFQNITYVDDLLIYADTIQEHNKKIKGILEKAKEKNIKFDLTKAQICLTKVRFLGHLISQNGIDPEPNKNDKLITFKRPEDKKSLQRIMGLYNYLGKFIPNLAASTSNIRGILKKNVVWHWGPKQDGEFNHIKECVRNAPSLAHFDKSKMLILQCDASKDAMGAALLQEDRPLAFASASFSVSQKQYSQIEKELPSVYYGCKKFEYLLSGHTFVVQTDHQSLLPLVKKPLSDISPRLQRLVMKLIAFDFKLQYKPGKYLIVADTLSRDTHPMDELSTPFLEDKRMVKMVCVNISDEKLVTLQKDTREDPALVKVIDYVIEGWPICKKDVEEDAKAFFDFRHREDAWCQMHPRETWTTVKISAQANSPQSFEVVTPSGNKLIRNQQFIRPKDGVNKKRQLSSEPITSSPEAQHLHYDSPTMGESSTSPIQRSKAVMNGRPMTYGSDDPNDLVTISPSMFLQEQTDVEFPECQNMGSNPTTPKLRYLSKLREELKSRFRKEYLSRLVQRNRRIYNPKLQAGDVVLVVMDNKKRNFWPLAVIEEILFGRDGVIKLVKVKTAVGTFLRPIQKIYPLEISSTAAFSRLLNDKEKTAKIQTRSGRTFCIPNRLDDYYCFSVCLEKTAHKRIITANSSTELASVFCETITRHFFTPSNANFGNRIPPEFNEPTCALNQRVDDFQLPREPCLQTTLSNLYQPSPECPSHPYNLNNLSTSPCPSRELMIKEFIEHPEMPIPYQQLLYSLKDIFRINKFNVLPLNITPVKLKIISDKVISLRPYRTPYAYQKEIQDQASQILKHDIITPSSSPYSSPVTLVRKRDNTMRLCIDFRHVNELVPSDLHPLPLIETVLDNLSKARVFSTVDISNAYYQIPIAEESQPLLSFVNQQGQYNLKRLPFGFRSAPQIFECVITQLIHKHHLSFIAHYYDYFVIFSDSSEQHLTHLRLFFKFCLEEKLQLNIKKCNFYQNEIDFLSYHITSGTYTPNIKNTEIINAIRTPINIKTLQSFLGAVNVYHKFIPEYARLRHPLNQLLKKNAKWLWSPNCQQAFDKLKQHLATQPVLHLFQEGLPCQVYCDASTQGIAGVLKQVHPDGNIYPVQYYSRALRSYERNYTISELECLAIVECVDKFRVYLLGTRFVIYLDHHALQWLKTIKDPTGRLFRWSLRHSAYDYEVKYLKGSRQYEADLLSCNPFCGFLSTSQIKDHQGELHRDTSPSDFNHPGISQMTRLIAAQYYWHGMTNDIRTPVRACSICQLVKPPKGPIYGELGQLLPAVLQYELVSLDTISGFAKYGNSQTFLHVVVDHATRYAWAFPSRSTSILTYTQVIKKVMQFGSPKRLLMDRAPAFTSQKFRRFLIRHNIGQLLTTSNNPQANGLSERRNATITGKLKLLRLQQPKTAWTKLLPQVLQAYNNTPHSVTGFPPSYLLLGSFPLQLSEHVQKYPKINEARELPYQRTHERPLCDKARFDQTHRASDFELGDLVLAKTYYHPDTGKLEPFFSGPYEILEIISPQIVWINHSNRPLSRETDTIHVNKLKHYTENKQFISPPVNDQDQPKIKPI
ncbi:hypothetical protein LAZ67_8003250 [Cordylochernes scorpioides]|uniref:RNA-directed DNA polymerase n=1 Tax=Cordylochernes scorpioides TaxID=51811 RepID=A0ABY6KTD7_9ARAC|nr:hypothetical protein LAZ67_8003250 [Cordylochernes scorpioides]